MKLKTLPDPLKLPATVPTLLVLVRVALPLAKTFNPDAVMVVAPCCDTLPVTFTIKLRPMEEVANINELAFVMRASLVAPLFVKLTPLLKALACVKVMAFAPASKLETPDIVNAPDCVIAPPVVT